MKIEYLSHYDVLFYSSQSEARATPDILLYVYIYFSFPISKKILDAFWKFFGNFDKLSETYLPNTLQIEAKAEEKVKQSYLFISLLSYEMVSKKRCARWKEQKVLWRKT